MRYQSALVLSTLAVGQAAASSHGHAAAHRHAALKRDAQDVDWNKVTYDLSGVDWSKVDYGNGASNDAASSPAAAVAAAATTPAASQPEVVATSAAAPEPATTTTASAPVTTSESSSDDSGSIGDAIGDILSGIESFATKLGAKVGLNSETENGQIWIGGDGKYSATFKNEGSDEAMIWCWTKTGMWINANVPLISIKLGAGESQKLSIAEGFSGGCGASLPDSDLFMGLLNESILEFTTGSGANGAFDISREINMDGVVLTAKGSVCTTGMQDSKNVCTFICTADGATRCGEGGGDYAITGQSGSGCMVGTDPYTGDASGGCQMGTDGEAMEITIHGTRSWPSLTKDW